MTKYDFTLEQRDAAQGVLDYFKKYPMRHDQGSWFEIDGKPMIGLEPMKQAEMVEENLCKTTMCAAGTVMWNAYGKIGLALFADNETLDLGQREAGRLLGLTEYDYRTLFWDTSDEEAIAVLKRIAKGKKNIWKGTCYEGDD